MTSYAETIRKYGDRFLLRVLMQNGGDLDLAAAAAGVHRNTISRALSRAGCTAWEVRREVRKPAASVDAAGQERKIA